MAGAASRGGPALLAVTALRSPSAAPGRARPCARPRALRAHPSRPDPPRDRAAGADSGSSRATLRPVTTPLPPIAFARHPARRGIAWLREAAVMLAAARMRWLMLLFAYYSIQWLAAFVPAVGPLAMMIGRPVFTVGFLAAAWTQQRGGVPQIGHLFHGFRTDLRALLPIGVVLVAGTIFAVLATALVDGGALLDMISAGGRPDEAIVASPRIEIAMLFGIVCALPTLLAVWFAPALVVFQDCSARRALATSFRAAMANWRPLAVYGLLLFFY